MAVVDAGGQLFLNGRVSNRNEIINCTRIWNDGQVVVLPELKFQIKGAEQRLIALIQYSISRSSNLFIVISNDTGCVYSFTSLSDILHLGLG